MVDTRRRMPRKSAAPKQQYHLHTSNSPAKHSSSGGSGNESDDAGAYLNAMYHASVHHLAQSGRLMGFATMPMQEVFHMALVYGTSILNSHAALERNLTHAPFTLQHEPSPASPWRWSMMNGISTTPVLIHIDLRQEDLTKPGQYVFTLEMMFPMPKDTITTSQPFSSKDGRTLLTNLLALLRGLLYS